MISGEDAAVDQYTVSNWRTRLATILEQYNPVDIYNCDETDLYHKLMPDTQRATIRKNRLKAVFKFVFEFLVLIKLVLNDT